MQNLEDEPHQEAVVPPPSSPADILLQCLQKLGAAVDDDGDIDMDVMDGEGDESGNVNDAIVASLIKKVVSQLGQLERPVSSGNIPYRLLRDAVFDITQRSSEYSTDTNQATCLMYITLISLVPIAYDEAAFSSSVNLMANALKSPTSPANNNSNNNNQSEDEETQSGGRRKKKATKKSAKQSASTKKQRTTQFWKALLNLVTTDTFRANFKAVGQITANAFAQLLMHGGSENERIVAKSGLKLLTHDFNVVYKALFPVALSGLKGGVKTDFLNLVLGIIRAEHVAIEQQETTRNTTGRKSSTPLAKTALSSETDNVETPSSRRRTRRRSSTARQQRRSSEPTVDGENNDEPADGDIDTIISTPSTPKTPGGSKAPKMHILGFLLYCIAYIPERADDRKAVFELIDRCIASFQAQLVLQFAEKLAKLAKNDRPTVRLFVCNVAASLTSADNRAEINDDENDSDEKAKKISDIVVDILCDGVLDVSPAVRVKALMSISELLDKNKRQSANKDLIAILESKKLYLKTLEQDEKVTVRKAFVQMAGTLVRALLYQLRNDEPGTPQATNTNTEDVSRSTFRCTPGMLLEWIAPVKNRTVDLMSSVRKAAIIEAHETAFDLLLFNNTQIQNTLVNLWCHAVLARIVDDEPACQDKCIESFSEFFVASLEEEGSGANGRGESKWNNNTVQRTMFVEHILSIAGDATNSLSGAVRTIMGRIAKKDGIRIEVLFAFEKRIFSMYENDGNSATVSETLRNGIWVLFSECLTKSMLVSTRRKLKSVEIYELALRECSLWSGPVAAFFADELTADEQQNTIADLVRKLFDIGQWSESFWRKSVRAIMATISGINVMMGSEILDKCEDILENKIGWKEKDKTVEYLTVISIIGECCTKLQLSRAPSQQLLNFVLAMASTSQKSLILRASSVLVLCRICLSEGSSPTSSSVKENDSDVEGPSKALIEPNFFENFARTCIPLFVSELQDGTNLAVRNNCIIGLSELCRRFTSIVEPYSTRIAARLADDSETIRCHVLGAIGSLLQEDYLKVRSGPVFFRIVLALLDESPTVRKLAKYILTKILHRQMHTLLSTTIIELVYVLNGVTENPKYNQFPEQHIGWDGCTSGHAKKFKTYPYELFISSMTQDQILLLSSRICSEILTPAVDGKLTIRDPKITALLSDSLFLLQRVQKSPAISFESASPGESGPGNSNMNSQASSQGSMGSGNISAPRTKADLIRTVRLAELKNKLIPLLLELRCMLENERSPILADVRHTLCAVLKPHRKKLNEVLSDPIVLTEIEHLFSKQRESNEHKKRQLKFEKGDDNNQGGADENQDDNINPASNTPLDEEVKT